MFKYIFKGASHSNTSAEYMQNLGMNQEQIDAVLKQLQFELRQNVEKRQAAYKVESDPLFMEAIRKEAAGDLDGAQAARMEALQVVADIKAKYPLPEVNA